MQISSAYGQSLSLRPSYSPQNPVAKLSQPMLTLCPEERSFTPKKEKGVDRDRFMYFSIFALGRRKEDKFWNGPFILIGFYIVSWP